ncbi:MAG: sugar phosphate isomerase/epimerase family protein [Bryobacteraceae bacterium]
MSYQFKLSLCNEAFQSASFANAAKVTAKAGYGGIEIAPFTLSDDPAKIPAAERRQYRSIMQSEGLRFVGLHWLLVSPKDLHVTTPDRTLRERSWEYVRSLVDLCADFGPDGVMIFGSPKQRSTTGGISSTEATRNFVDGLAKVAPHAAARGVRILVEALPKVQSDIVCTLAEAVRVVHEVGSPAVRTMFDTHNTNDETEPHAVLVEKYFDLIQHVHVNEMDGRYPGAGNYDFKPVLEVLQRRDFQGWVSAEVFDFKPGAEMIASETIRHLKAEIGRIGK